MYITDKKTIILFLVVLLFICGCQLENNKHTNTNEFTADFFYHYIESNSNKNYIMFNICIYNDKIDDLDKVELIYDKDINYNESSNKEYNTQFAKDFFSPKIGHERKNKPFYYIYETHLSEDFVTKTFPSEIKIKYKNEEITIAVNAFIKLE